MKLQYLNLHTSCGEDIAKGKEKNKIRLNESNPAKGIYMVTLVHEKNQK